MSKEKETEEKLREEYRKKIIEKVNNLNPQEIKQKLISYMLEFS